ncbi:hypothetical protein SAMN06275492_1612 [Dethiosulfovibrio salsuginis]|uniref:Uncharacterized protein n=1 Tax=Dethiosulfovibrio salsuginis TaxID=561720 RepID=A0A1X7LER1_9BACT|nr:hypothetical protein SAMN06275492_1612 [Dethiosulfovibrio salsuginis]
MVFTNTKTRKKHEKQFFAATITGYAFILKMQGDLIILR